MASTAKRLGEDKFFSGAFGVLCHISVIFREFCLVVKRILLNLHTEKVLSPLVAMGLNCEQTIIMETSRDGSLLFECGL